MKLLVKNGTLINPLKNEKKKTSILIENGKIIEIADFIDEYSANGQLGIIDAQGLYVAPGFIDIHVHFRDPGFEWKEDIFTGLEAAAAGGYTSVCTMPNTNPVADNVETVKYMVEKGARGNGVKLYPVCSATAGLKGEELVSFEELKSNGAVAFSDDGKPVYNTELLKKAMETAALSGMKYISHSEDPFLAEGGCMNDGKQSKDMGLKGIPVVGEASQVARDCMLAEYLGLPVHIAHVSCAMSVDIIKYFKERGVEVTAETAPHYLVLTDGYVKNFGTNAKMNPPLREEKDRLALIEGIKNGVIDCLATDHAPHHTDEKKGDMNSAPFGIIGLETAFPVMMKLYHEGVFSLDKIVELFVKGYSIMGVEGGVVEVGMPADLTIFDIEKEWVIDSEKFRSKARNTPFHGLNVKGAVIHTVCRGKVINSGSY